MVDETDGDTMKYHELRRRMVKDAAEQGIPLLGEFELSARCNFDCTMCYVADRSAKDLDTHTWKRLFDDAVEAGLFFALLTGGELFTRRDFPELYAHLYDAGVKITLFSNGALIDERIRKCLIKRPPEFLAITLYGASDETYERITGDAQGFTKVDRAIEALKTTSINVLLRTIPIRGIEDDLEALIAYAKRHDSVLTCAPYIAPPRSGADVDTIRLQPEALNSFLQRLRSAFGAEADVALTTSTNAATCAALKSAYYIDHRGMMRPCALAPAPARSVLGEPFLDTFRELSRLFKPIEHHEACRTCPEADSCMQCYARRLLEGDADACAPYLLTLAKAGKEVA